MRNKKNLLAVLGIGLLLFAAYAVPTTVTALEDRSLQSESKKYKIEEIKLTAGETDLIEKLSAIQGVLDNNFLIQRSIEGTSQEQEAIAETVKEFLILVDGKTERDFLKFYTVLQVMADSDTNKVYSLWECYVVDADEWEYFFRIDEETGKVLAFEIPFDADKTDAERLYKMAGNLAKYYGFSSGGFVDKIADYLEEEYFETALHFWNETTGEDMMIMFYKNGSRIGCNMYPYNTAVQYN